MKKLMCMLIVAIMFVVVNPSIAKADAYSDWLYQISLEGYPSRDIEHGYQANLTTYLTYDKKIVYGKFLDVPENKQSGNYKSGEYRYLGYNKIGELVTNERFPNEVPPSGKPEEWHFSIVDGAKESWDNLIKEHPQLYDYNWNAPLEGHGAITLKPSNIGDTSKILLQTPATIFTEGSYRVEHDEGSGWRYATFTIHSMGNENDFVGGININDIFYMKENENTINIPFELYAKLNTSNPYYKENYVNGIGARIMKIKIDDYPEVDLTDYESYSINLGEKLSVNDNFSMNFERIDFNPSLDKHSITFIGYAGFASKFGDTKQIPIRKKSNGKYLKSYI